MREKREWRREREGRRVKNHIKLELATPLLPFPSPRRQHLCRPQAHPALVEDRVLPRGQALVAPG